MRKIKTALAAYGFSGKIFHIPFLETHPGFEFVGAWERKNKNVQTDYPNSKSYPSFEELLADDVELVIINTPIHTHFEYTKKALEANKHVLVEKAFTSTLKEAEILKELAKAKKRSLTVFQNRRWDSDFKTVQAVINSGKLGEIVEAEIRFDRYNPNLSTKKWKEEDNDGNGILMDLGSHIIDQALCLFGKPNAVFADLRKIRQDSSIYDNLDATFYYPETTVRLHAGFFNLETLPAYTIQGRNGSFLKHRGDVQEAALIEGQKPNYNNWGTEEKELEGILHLKIEDTIIRERTPSLQGNYMAVFDGVHQTITQNKPEIVSAEDGANVMQVIEAIKKSHQSKQIVYLN